MTVPLRGWEISKTDLSALGSLLVSEPFVSLVKNSVVPGSSCELPNTEGGGGPAGVNDLAEEGGGPAGVVDGLVAKTPYECLWLSLVCLRLSGVEGGLEENGTVKPPWPDMLRRLRDGAVDTLSHKQFIVALDGQ